MVTKLHREQTRVGALRGLLWLLADDVLGVVLVVVHLSDAAKEEDILHRQSERESSPWKASEAQGRSCV